MSVIAPDAMFVESGKLETRAEYEMNHLPVDIDFEKQVTAHATRCGSHLPAIPRG